MTIPSSGTISLGDVRSHTGKTGSISLNDPHCRNLAGKYGSSTISLNDIRVNDRVESINHANVRGSQTNNFTNYTFNLTVSKGMPGQILDITIEGSNSYYGSYGGSTAITLDGNGNWSGRITGCWAKVRYRQQVCNEEGWDCKWESVAGRLDVRFKTIGRRSGVSRYSNWTRIVA